MSGRFRSVIVSAHERRRSSASMRNAAHFEPVIVAGVFGLRECSGLGMSCMTLFARQPELRANAPEFESGLGFYDLTVHLKQRIDQEIDRSAFRFRVDHQIATLR